MRTFDCPQCGATVPFQSSVTVSTTCSFCRSIVVRKGLNVESLGLQAELPPDLSPLQIGTTGVFEGRPFTLVGRVRVGYTEGAWNEWCADFGEGAWGWIAEAQGHFMASFEIAPEDDFPGALLMRTSRESEDTLQVKNFGHAVGRENLPLGKTVAIGGQEYTVRDSKLTRVLGADGELPFVPVKDGTAWSVDLGASECRFANAEYSETGLRLFVGRFCEFEDLKFSNLRAVPGWTTDVETQRNQTAALACPQCGAAVTLRAAGFSVTAVCGSCGTGINAATPELETIRIGEMRKTFPPIIPLGTRGTLRGLELECIAFLRRTDNYGDTWSEYLLFNPFHGFRWLVTYRGHWSFVRTLLEPPPMPEGSPVVNGIPLRLFGHSTATVTYVLGEVYWKMRVQERTECQDFIHPPLVVSSEKYPDLAEVTWSVGDYLLPGEVQQAFKLEKTLPEPTGTYLNAPNPHREKGASLRRWVPIFLGLALLAQLLTASRSAREVVLDHTFEFQAKNTTTNSVFSTPEFEVRGAGSQALLLKSYSPLQNQWMEVSYDLINTSSNQVQEVFQSIEYYSGFDGEAWTEGDQTEETILAAIKPGRYRLLVEPEWDPSRPPSSLNIQLTRDVPIWSNFWISLAALLIYPIFRWSREHSFERSRWQDSDFSPYASVTDDD